MSRSETWSQRERRFRLGRHTAQKALPVLAANLPLIQYQPDCSTSLVVTTYLDTPERHYLNIADSSDGKRSVKLRIREYLAPADTETGFTAFRSTCFLERKERVDDVRLKQRIEIDKTELGNVLAGQARIVEQSGEAQAIATELDALELAPVLVSVYERRVFGSERGLRVTYDERLAYYRPPEGLYDRAAALTHYVLGRALARGPSRILEIKFPADSEIPPWLRLLLVDMDEAQTFSKFRDGMHAIDESDGPVHLTRPIELQNLS